MALSAASKGLRFYTYLTDHIVPGPNNLDYAIPFVLLFSALCIPPSVLSHKQLCCLFLPVIYAFQIHSWRLMHGIDVISVSLAFWSFVLLVCHDPRREFRRIHRLENVEKLEKGNDGKVSRFKELPTETTETENGELREQKSEEGSEISNSELPHDAIVPKPPYYEEPYPPSLPRRIIWVLTLLPSLRLPSWLINIPSHDAHQPPAIISRRAFLRHALLAILEGYLILDLTSLYTAHDPYFHLSHLSVSTPFPPSSASTPPLLALLWNLPLPPRLLRMTVLTAQIYALIPRLFFLPSLPLLLPFPPLLQNSLYLIPSIWSPQTWGPFFGPFSSVALRGLRGLWGQWWHQMNRHLTSTPGILIADRLGLKPRGYARYSLMVLSAFTLSGIMHMGLIPPFPLETPLSANAMRLYVAAFFWVQILGVLLETGVAAVVGRWAPRWKEGWVARGVALGWVAGWLGGTLPLLVVPFRELGYWEYAPVPVSLCRGVRGEGWLAWW